MDAKSKVVPPGTVRINLADGGWMEVKRELNAGETNDIYRDLIKDYRAGQPAELDVDLVGLTKALQYLVRWSLIDPTGAELPITAAALNSIGVDDQKEILELIEAHDESVHAARAARKNVRATATESAPTS